MKLFLLLSILLSFNTWAYIQSRTSSGFYVRWPSAAPILTVAVDTASSQDISASNAETIIRASIAQYSSQTRITLTGSYGSYPDVTGVNTINFTTQPYFSSGVIAVTNVSYSATSGIITEADIFLNELFTFTTSTNPASGTYYLGDVVTHELGHFMGLSHSEVQDSTMMYSLFRGQYTLSEDDLSGLNSIYPKSNLGNISGKVIGGKSATGIFGAHVQAISTIYAKVAAATVTDQNGNFSLSGLPLNDNYYIYVSPLKYIAALPGYYSSVTSNFCAGASFRGAYFSKCGDAEIDKPLAVSVTSTTTKSIGNITIRCNFNTHADYLDQKNSTNRDAREIFNYSSATGGARTGIFFDFEKLGPSDTTYYDTLTVDLRTVSSPSGKNLDLKFVSQSLFSPLATSIYVTRGSTVYSYPYNYLSPVYNSDSTETLNRSLTVPLSATASDNYFSIKVVGISSSQMNSTSTLFPVFSTFGEAESTYLMVASISDGTSLVSMQNGTPTQDNNYCPEGSTVYKVSAFTSNKDGTSDQNQGIKETSPLTCGTIDIDSNNPPPPGGTILGMSIGFFIVLAIRRVRKILVS